MQIHESGLDTRAKIYEVKLVSRANFCHTPLEAKNVKDPPRLPRLEENSMPVILLFCFPAIQNHPLLSALLVGRERKQTSADVRKTPRSLRPQPHSPLGISGIHIHEGINNNPHTRNQMQSQTRTQLWC